jgi:hypothetical protein
MEFTVSMGWAGVVLLVVGSLVTGVVAELFGEPSFTYEWVATGVAAFVGAVIGSELIVGLRAFEPVWDGVALVPALAGGLVAGLATVVAFRLVSGGAVATHRPGHA